MPSHFSMQRIPSRAGIGFRTQHTDAMLSQRPSIAWIEVHAENYLVDGGPRLKVLETLRTDYPLSVHGVGASLGSADGLNDDHLQRLKVLVDRFQPGLISDHVAWSVTGGVYYNDLLPLPYTEEALTVLCRNIDHMQTALGRQILVENPSTYLTFSRSNMPEWEFLAELPKRTGCGLLLDVNNIYVSASNHDFDADRYLDALPLDKVQEIHVAGHTVEQLDGCPLLIDDHGSAVADVVWGLFRAALSKLGRVPTLVEWDSNLPELSALLAEAAKADTWLDQAEQLRSRHAA